MNIGALTGEKDNMGIPPLDDRGLLPEGAHRATLQELEAWSRTVPDVKRRLELLNKLKKFITVEIGKKYHLSNFPIVLGGSFFTDKLWPGDIDLAIEVPGEFLINLGNSILRFHMNHKFHKEIYELDTYVSVLGGGNNFEDFFGYLGEKSGLEKGLPPKTRKGTVRIEP